MVISSCGGGRYLAYIVFFFVPLLMNGCGKEEKPEDEYSFNHSLPRV